MRKNLENSSTGKISATKSPAKNTSLNSATKPKIAVFGLGFVGLTTAVGFAKKGFEVAGFELDEMKAKDLCKGKISFFEEGLNKALDEVLNQKLFISADIKSALEKTKIIFICIGTPMSADGSANLDYIKKALKDIANFIKLCAKAPIIVIKSTCPPASCEQVFAPFVENLGLKQGVDFILANNPEFLREGFAYSDFIHPDRVVIGTQTGAKIKELEQIYKPFNAPIFFVSLNTAEFIKYLSNTTLSLNISYANEMSMIAQNIGNIDIIKAFDILHEDKRFSGAPAGITSYLYPGMGFGGYCLPKDTLALYKTASIARGGGIDARILKAVLDVNDEILSFYTQKIAKEQPKSAKIGILGLSFKPKSDDVRDSKAASLIEELLNLGFSKLYAFDPLANEIFAKTYDFNITYKSSLKDLLKECEILIIATAWSEFKQVLKLKDKKIYNLRFMKA